jgi:hypothetical protein
MAECSLHFKCGSINSANGNKKRSENIMAVQSYLKIEYLKPRVIGYPTLRDRNPFSVKANRQESMEFER